VESVEVGGDENIDEGVDPPEGSILAPNALEGEGANRDEEGGKIGGERKGEEPKPL